MARATGHKCDRCGRPCKDKHGRDYPPKVVEAPNTQKGVGWLKTVGHELCEDCWGEFLKFMDNHDLCEHKPVNVCHHHIPCAGPCETVWR